MAIRCERFAENPLIVPNMDVRMGDNINGPSVLRVPDWVPRRLGIYYLYFAHHQGTYMRLAYADSLRGPWQTHEDGVLDLQDSFFQRHIASPDLHIDEAAKRIRMYYHGVIENEGQFSRVALSEDGLTFEARPEILGCSYFRVFTWQGWHYALGMPGILYRSRDGLGGFERGPTLFTRDMRHSAVHVKEEGEMLSVYYSNAFDCPERILRSQIHLAGDWESWKEESEPELVLQPETDYEGADLELEPSKRGTIKKRVRQLRDPCIFEDEGQTFLFYSVAGESGLAGARIEE